MECVQGLRNGVLDLQDPSALSTAWEVSFSGTFYREVLLGCSFARVEGLWEVFIPNLLVGLLPDFLPSEAERTLGLCLWGFGWPSRHRSLLSALLVGVCALSVCEREKYVSVNVYERIYVYVWANGCVYMQLLMCKHIFEYVSMHALVHLCFNVCFHERRSMWMCDNEYVFRVIGMCECENKCVWMNLCVSVYERVWICVKIYEFWVF